MTISRYLLAALAAMALVLLPPASVKAKVPSVGSPAPEFELPMLDGSRSLKLSSLRGKVVLIDFWATWCGPCKKELPKLQELYDAHKSRGFVVLAITVDEDTDAAKRFASARKMTMPVLSDASGAVAGKYDLPKMPTSFLLDKKGVVRVVHEGYRSGDARKLEEKIRKLLSE